VLEQKRSAGEDAAAKLEEIHAKMVMKEGTPRTTSSAKQTIRSVPSSSKPMANGIHASTSSSSSKMNGKPYR
jgi:chromodomain-helicase-DNA-binding protein 1